MLFTVSYKGVAKKFKFEETDSINKLQTEILNLWSILPQNQKWIGKGIKKNKDTDKSLNECGIRHGSRFMLMGSTEKDLQSVREPVIFRKPMAEVEAEKDQDLWETFPQCAKIISRGPIGDVPTERKRVALPIDNTIKSLRDQSGNKLRMTLNPDHIKMSTDTGSWTIHYNIIRDYEIQEITQFPGYSTLRLELNSVLHSQYYYIYFVPDNYIDALKLVLSIKTIFM